MSQECITLSPVPQAVYNRSRRVYQLETPNGERLEFPAGPEGRTLAFQTAVSLFAPEVADAAAAIIRRHPHLERRVWRAVNCLLGGGVKILPDLNDIEILALVDSSDGFGAYAIRHQASILTCECEDFTSFSAPYAGEGGQSYCYHILAYRLALKIFSSY